MFDRKKTVLAGVIAIVALGSASNAQEIKKTFIFSGDCIRTANNAVDKSACGPDIANLVYSDNYLSFQFNSIERNKENLFRWSVNFGGRGLQKVSAGDSGTSFKLPVDRILFMTGSGSKPELSTKRFPNMSCLLTFGDEQQVNPSGLRSILCSYPEDGATTIAFIMANLALRTDFGSFKPPGRPPADNGAPTANRQMR